MAKASTALLMSMKHHRGQKGLYGDFSWVCLNKLQATGEHS